MFLKKYAFIFIIVFIGQGCKPSSGTATSEQIVSVDDLQLVKSLKTFNAKQAFLDDILDGIMEDRKLKKEPAIIEANDKERLHKIEAYLQTYEYPSKDDFGVKAARAPIMTLYYTNDKAAMDRNFKNVYRGCLKRHISPEDFSYYISSYHKAVKGERLTFDGPFTSLEEINGCIKSLGLQDDVEAIIKEKKK